MAASLAEPGVTGSTLGPHRLSGDPPAPPSLPHGPWAGATAWCCQPSRALCGLGGHSGECEKEADRATWGAGGEWKHRGAGVCGGCGTGCCSWFLGCFQCIEVALVRKAYECEVCDVTAPCLHSACSPSSLLSFRNRCGHCGAGFVCKETSFVFIKSLSVTRISWCPISGV